MLRCLLWWVSLLSGLTGIILSAGKLNKPDLRFENFNLEDGLSQSVVECMVQDKLGYLWIGTQDGLNRYDGYDFHIYRHDPKDPNSLSDNWIFSLYEDGNGVLWVGTQDGGLNRYDREQDRFSHISHRADDPTSLSQNHISGIAEAGGYLWLGTNDNGLNRYHPGTGEIKRFDFSGAGPLMNGIQGVTRGENNIIWISCFGGVLKFDFVSETWKRYGRDQGIPEQVGFCEVVMGRNGDVWVGAGPGLFKYQPVEDRWKRMKNAGFVDTQFNLRGIFEDPDGILWLCTYGRGLLMYDPVEDYQYQYLPQKERGEGLTEARISQVLMDRAGIYWIGTFTGGLFKLDRSMERFQHIRDGRNSPGGLSDGLVFTVMEEPGSKGQVLWVGTGIGGLNRVDRRTGETQVYDNDSKDPTSINGPWVWSSLVDRAGAFWVGTFAGLNHFDPQTGCFTPHYPDMAVGTHFSKSGAVTLFEDHADELWIGTFFDGIYRLDKDRKKYTIYRPQKDFEQGISNLRIRAIIEDRHQRLWVGTWGGGLARMDEERDYFTHFRRDDNNPAAITHDVILCLFEDRSNDTLWIGTWGGGLNRMDMTSESISAYRRGDGLPNDTVYGILEDEAGYLWLSTNLGLTQFDPEAETFRNFDLSDGLMSMEFDQGAFCKSETGEMFFGTINGVTSFFPSQMSGDPYAPPMVVNQFLLFNKPTPLQRQNPQSPLAKSIDMTEEITLTHQDQVFSFEFAALHLGHPERNRYAYQLEGFDASWVYTDASRRFATYTNLDPGAYRFKVKGANKDGIWSPEPRVIDVKILPPWWNTIWAIMLYAFVLAGLVLAYLHSQRKKLEYERSINRMKDEFLANTSHELRTPLNGIIGLAESLADGIGGPVSDVSARNLGMIISSGRRLSALINDILDFSKLKNKHLQLQSRALDLHPLVEVVLTLSQTLTGGKQLTLINDISMDEAPVWADENRVQQILLNLVGNAIKFTPAGEIRVSIKIEGEMAVVAVSDTGIGIPEDARSRIFNSFEQADGSTSRHYGGTGLGLSVTKHLVSLHGGRIWLESNPGKGSVFYFSLPLSTKPVAKSHDDALIQGARFTSIQPESLTDESSHHDFKPGRFNILIVDDEPVNRQVLINHLSLQDYNIAEAVDGREALALLDSERHFDLILLDIMMPGLSGYEVCKILRENRKVQDLPIIFLTAKNQVSDLVSAFHSGANDYLTKPVTKAELLSRVKTHLQLLEINRKLESKVRERTLELEAKNTQLEYNNRELETLDQIVKTINRELTLPQLLKTLLAQAPVLFPTAERGSFWLWDALGDSYRFAAGMGYEQEHMEARFFSRDALMGRYVEQGEKLEEGIFLSRGNHSDGCTLSLTLRLSEELHGLLILENREDPAAFDDSDVRKLERFREHAVSAVAKARFVEELHEKNQAIVDAQNRLVMEKKMASIGALTAGIAHEIRNPLNFINNFSELSLELTKDLRGELEPQKTRLDETAYSEINDLLQNLEKNSSVVRDHGLRATAIVSNMMDLAKTQETNFEVIDINAITEVRARSGLDRVGEQGRDILFTLNTAADLPTVHAVSDNIGQAIENLVHNAAESLLLSESGNGRIWVETRRADHMVEICVIDNGPGIPNADREKIFDPFYTTKPTGTGNTGMGLCVAFDMIVRKHEGELTVSNHERGIMFCIRLPIRTQT